MLEKLKTFIALADCGSYTEAARKLYCSQPSVSQHIKFLEKHYDTRLVVRRHNQIELTEHGEMLREQAARFYVVRLKDGRCWMRFISRLSA